MERINPLKYKSEKQQEQVAKEKVMANKNAIDDVSKCPVPECTTPMEILEVNGINCHVCLNHRIALPVKDEE